MKKYKICKILLVILAIFLCVAFYELLGIHVAYKKQPEVSPVRRFTEFRRNDHGTDGEKRAVELQNFYADLQKAVWLYTSENALEPDTAHINSFEIYCSYTH